MTAVWDSRLPHNQKFVLLAYADHANDEGGNIWPSITSTARKTGYSDRAVQKLTRQLTDLGILIDDGTHINNVHRWRIDLQRLAAYTPTEPPSGEQNSPPAAPPPPTDQPGGENHDNQAVNSTTPGGEQNSPKPTTEPSTPTTEPSNDDDDGLNHIPDTRSSHSEKKRARVRATRRPTTHPSTPPPPIHPGPLPDYPTANTHPAALDAAILHAGILNPATRRRILDANPALTVAQILAWDSYRVNANAAGVRHTDPGALVALLTTGAKPPRTRTDPAAAEHWLISAGYLPQPEPSDPSDHPNPSIPAIRPQPDPDPAAANLWQQTLTQVQLANRAAYDNWLRRTTAAAYDPANQHLTITVPDPQAHDWISQRMAPMLQRHLARIAGHPITLTFQLP